MNRQIPNRSLPFILASSSPRRHALLSQAGLKFSVLPCPIEETADHSEPALFALAVARKKALHAATLTSGPAVILAADTVVASGRDIFGKPASREDARRMLLGLCGGTHRVITGVALHRIPDGRATAWTEITYVTMRTLVGQELENYLESDEWHDKAGGYAIQGTAGAWVKRLQGSYTNVVGLPLAEVLEELEAGGWIACDR
jgi:septum formation protein